jgi:transposase
MDIRQHAFRQEEIQQLQQYRDKQRDGRLKVRLIALLMLAESMSIDQVAFLIGRSVKMITYWGHQYLTQGIDSLNAFNYKPKKTFLQAANRERNRYCIHYPESNNSRA